MPSSSYNLRVGEERIRLNTELLKSRFTGPPSCLPLKPRALGELRVLSRATQPGNSSPACGGTSGARSSTFQPSPVAFLARASR